MITHFRCWENTWKACKSLAFGSWCASFTRALSTFRVGYHAGKPIESVVYCLIKLSQLILQRNVWRSVWRIYMWILGLKGFTEELSLGLDESGWPVLTNVKHPKCTWQNRCLPSTPRLHFSFKTMKKSRHDLSHGCEGQRQCFAYFLNCDGISIT